MRLPLSLATILGVTLAHPAQAEPQQAAFTGTKQLTIKASAAYDTDYPARDFAPPLEVTISSTGGSGRSVAVTDTRDKVSYCPLRGEVVGGKLTLTPNQTCELKNIATPDFCILADQRCNEHLSHRRCSDETKFAGPLKGTLIQGSVTQRSGGGWDLSLDLAADGCVLAEGYNNGGPVRVRGGSVTVRTP
jgi:hypothetical protein